MPKAYRDMQTLGGIAKHYLVPQSYYALSCSHDASSQLSSQYIFVIFRYPFTVK